MVYFLFKSPSLIAIGKWFEWGSNLVRILSAIPELKPKIDESALAIVEWS